MRRAFALLLLAATLVAIGPAPAAADDFVVIANAKAGVSSVSRGELKKLYSGGTKQLGGAVAQPVIGEDGGAELAWLASTIFGTTTKELLTLIKQQIFRGEMKRPVVAKTADDCLTAVRRADGGFGVVAASAAKKLPSGVVALKLE